MALRLERSEIIMKSLKEYKTTIIITILITLLPVLFGLALWDKLPDSIPIHWGASGKPDKYASKPFAVFALPCILAALQMLCCFLALNDPKRKNIHRKPLMLTFWSVPVISVVVYAVTYLTALGNKIDIRVIISIAIGLLFVILGNYIPKLSQNYTIGIKIPWTLNSTENWNRTHRLGGKLFIAAGFLMILCGLLGQLLSNGWVFAVMLAVIVLCLGIPVIYSFRLFKKGI